MQGHIAALSMHENLIVKVKKNCGSDPEIFPNCLSFEFCFSQHGKKNKLKP